MKLRKFIITAVLALTGVGWGVKPASAALVYTAGDVLVGFYASGGTGASTSYVINLGNIDTYLNATGPVDLSYLGNLGADLSTIYGSEWATRDDLYWGIAAGTGSNTANSIVYGSHSRSEEGVVSEGWDPITTGQTRQSVRTAINSWGGTYQNGSVASTNSNYAATQSSALSAGFGVQVTSFGTFPANPVFYSNSGWTSGDFLADFGEGVDGAVLDFFRVGSNAANTYYVGTFSIDGSGNLSYSAVPEPSTYVLLTIAGLTLFVIRRRRRLAVKA